MSIQNSLSDCTQPPTAPIVEAFRHGYQYMSDNTLDHLEPVITPIRHALIGVGLPLRIIEAEWGPGQIEISLDPLENMAAADAVILLREAVKQSPAHGPACVLYGKASTAERVFMRLASSSIAVSCCERQKRLRNRWRPNVGSWTAFYRRAAGACTGDDRVSNPTSTATSGSMPILWRLIA